MVRSVARPEDGTVEGWRTAWFTGLDGVPVRCPGTLILLEAPMTHTDGSDPAPDATPAPSPTEVGEAAAVPSADTRSVFAAALEKKKAAGQARSSHLDGHGVDGSHTNSKATRTFRRKSGGGG